MTGCIVVMHPCDGCRRARLGSRVKEGGMVRIIVMHTMP